MCECLLTSSKLIRGLGLAPLIIARMIYSVTHMFTLRKCTFPSTTLHNTYKRVNHGGIYEDMFETSRLQSQHALWASVTELQKPEKKKKNEIK